MPSQYVNLMPKDQDLGCQRGEFSAKVIKFDPTKGDQWDLQVTILDGLNAGKSGWMLSDFLEDSRGELVNQFSKATVWEKLPAQRGPSTN